MQQDPSNENFNISFQCGNVFNNVSIPCSLTNASCKTQVPVNINPLLVLTCKYCSVVVVNKVKGTTASRMYETSYLSSVCPDTLPQRYKNRIEGFDAVGCRGFGQGGQGQSGYGTYLLLLIDQSFNSKHTL